MVFGGKIKTQSFQKLFSGGHHFVFVEYLCNRNPKIKTKNIKNYSSILAIVNHRNWLDDSPPLTINPQKCHVLLIPPKLNKPSTGFVVKLDDAFIKAENCVKYLVIHVDSNLNFRFHLEEIENKLSKSLGIHYKLKPIQPQNALLKLYIILWCILTYCAV